MQSTKTYTVPETSAILGVPQSTLYEQVREGRTTRFPKNIIDGLAAPEVA